VPPKTRLRASITARGRDNQKVFEAESETIRRLAQLEELSFDGGSKRVGAYAVFGDGSEVYVALEGAIDVQQECRRLSGELTRLEQQLAGLTAKLTNQQFVARAPAEVVAKEREKERAWRDSGKCWPTSSSRWLLLSALAFGCANQGAPPGGPPRTTPAAILSTVPESGAVVPDFRGKAVIQFDEVIDEAPGSSGGGAGAGAGRTGAITGLAQKIVLSPVAGDVKVSWHRSAIHVQPGEGFKPNRVYHLEVLPASQTCAATSRRPAPRSSSRPAAPCPRPS